MFFKTATIRPYTNKFNFIIAIAKLNLNRTKLTVIQTPFKPIRHGRGRNYLPHSKVKIDYIKLFIFKETFDKLNYVRTFKFNVRILAENLRVCRVAQCN